MGRRANTWLVSMMLVVCASAQGGASTQNDELALAALRSREAVFRAMNVAASQMQTSGDGSVADGTWRSGFVRHIEMVQVGRSRVSVEFRAIIQARMQGNPPDSVRTRFRAEVSADVPVQGSDRSSIARTFLLEFVTRTNQALAADAGH